MRPSEDLRRLYELLPQLLERRSLIVQIGMDLARESAGTTTYFPLDFYEIHNYLFPGSPGSRDPELVRYYLENLPHRLVLLPPSAWELIRYLEHQCKWLRTTYHPTATVIDEFLDSKEVREFREKVEKGSPSGEILQTYKRMQKHRRILDLLREDAVRTMLEEPAKAFIDLLEGQRLVSLQSLVEESLWQRIDEQVFLDALNAFDELRPSTEKKTANRIDALNLAMTSALNNSLYTCSSGGSFFALVTHAPSAERVYSGIRWRFDPLHTTHDGTPLNRNHLYCAFRAFFETGSDDPELAVRSYLEHLDGVFDLQKRFESLFKRYGRENLEYLSRRDHRVAADLHAIYEELARIDRSWNATATETVAGIDGSAIDAPVGLLDSLKKDTIKEILTERARVAGDLAEMVFQSVEPIVRSFPMTIMDRDYKKVIGFIASPSTTAIVPEEAEVIVISAYFKGHRVDQPFHLGEPYALRAEMRWQKPGYQPNLIRSTKLAFDVSIQGHGLDVSPSAIQELVVQSDGNPGWVGFEITPKEPGLRSVRVEFYRQRNLLGQIDLEMQTVANEEPPYRGLYFSTTYGRKHVPRLTRDPVTVNIDISHQQRNEHRVQIQCEASYLVSTVCISPDDLERLNTRMQSAAADVSICSSPDGQSTAEERKAALQNLAEWGKFAYETVFNEEIQSYLKSALEDRINEKITLQVTSDDLLLPWDLLFDHDLKSPFYAEFWGMRYIISRNTLTYRGPSSFVPLKIRYTSKPKVGLLTDDSLDAVTAREIPFFQLLDSRDRIRLVRLRPLEPGEEDVIEEFIQFWQEGFDVAHFACHAETEEIDPCLQISNECSIAAHKLISRNFEVPNYPLVVLNACHTGVVNPQCTLDLARTFLRCGARGVVATECVIPDAFAADFAQLLHIFLLQGHTLGSSLLAARRHFLKEHQNPSGLFYAMYAPAGLCLVKEE